MPRAASNAQTLLMRIFESWHSEDFPSYPPDAAFEIFTSELVLRPYGLAIEDIEAGIVGGGRDGAINSVYVFFDDTILDEDSDVVLPSRRPSEFGQDKSLELWVTQAKRSPSFSETAIDKLENSLRRLLDLTQALDSLRPLYNEQLLSRVEIFRSAWAKLLTRRPRISVHVAYATPGDTRDVAPQVEAKVIALKSVIASAIPDSSISVELLGDRELLNRYNERPSYTLTMGYQESATSGRSHVALVKLNDYYDLIVDENGRLRRHLFEKNVRDYQGNVAVNQDIRKSLNAPDSPEFWWLNNGVTIICSDVTSAGKTYLSQISKSLTAYRQATKSMRRSQEDPTPETKERMLLVRIVVTQDSATRDKVIRATNRQTAVSDASLRATDDVQRNIENFFLAEGWYYDRRKNYYKNEGKDVSRIVGIPFLGAAITAIGLARPDKSRGKPSSLLKNDDDYKQVFNADIDLEIYLWAAKLQRRVDAFIASDAAETTISQRSNLRYHLSMLIVEQLNSRPIRKPDEIRNLILSGATISDAEIKEIFEKLKKWSDDYLIAEDVILERATKAQRFSDYLLKRAADERKNLA